MNHQNIKEELWAFQDQELPEEKRLEIAGHLQTCEDCRSTLKRWEIIKTAIRRSASVKASEIFVEDVMYRLAAMEEGSTPAASASFLPKWLLPALGYAFAFVLMFMTILHQEPFVNTETVLLSDVPQSSHWTFSTEQPDMNKLLGVAKEEL